MSSTLRSLSSTLAQVSVRMGPSFGMKGSIAAGLCALAMVPVSHAQLRGDVSLGGGGVSVTAPDLTPGQGGESAGSASNTSTATGPISGITEVGDAAKNIGRLLGGFLGYQAARAADLGGFGKVLATAGGAVGGGMAADAMKRKPGDASVTTSQGRELPAEVQDRMRSLVIEAAAYRVIATKKFDAFERAELSAATQPGIPAAQRGVAESKEALNQAMASFRTSVSNLRHAVSTATQQGYGAQTFEKALAELSIRIGDPAAPTIDHPSVKSRVLAIEAAPAGVSLGDLSAQGLQDGAKQRTVADRR